MHAILDPGDITLCRLEYGIEFGPGGQSVLTDPIRSSKMPKVRAAFSIDLSCLIRSRQSLGPEVCWTLITMYASGWLGSALDYFVLGC